MKLVVDAQLPPALAQLLCELGQEAVALRAIGLHQADDRAIWQYALAQGAIIVTKDEDFGERSLRGPEAPRVLWLRVGNCSNRALVGWLRPLWPEIERRFGAGDRLVELS